MQPEVVGAILDVLRQRTGVDFSRYRCATVQRRIANRMISVGVESPDGYLALLQASHGEARQLLNRISIKVSRFYRHAAAFDTLAHEVIPSLAARGGPLRIWSAGCGCGEEPYTIAMLLEEAGVEGIVLATDIDPVAIEAAQAGRFSVEAAAELPATLAARYLVPLQDSRGFALGIGDCLRARVRFMRHDLLFASSPERAPFDLVACRNVLIYLQQDVRDEVFWTLLRSVRPGGFLCLGEAEWPPKSLDGMLSPLSRQSRVFQRVSECRA